MKGLDTDGDFDQYGIAGNPENESANCAQGEYLGQNYRGDFDQYTLHSIGGVRIDYGQNFDEAYNVQPKTLEGESVMNGHAQTQLGDAYELGVMPEYSMGSADYGVMPQMSGPYQQVGGPYQQVGSHYSQMGHQYNQMGDIVPRGLGGFVDDVKTHLTKPSPIPQLQNWMLYAGVAAVGIFALQRTGRKLGFAGL